eukprot:303500_1
MNDLLNVSFTSADTVQGRKQYTLYELRVSSSITPSWIILKRYSDFNLLNEQLIKRLQSDSQLRLQKNSLATMPKKKKFGNMKQDVIDKRKLKLEEYIRTLLRNEKLRRTDLVMDFLSVPEAVRQMILISTPDDRSKYGSDIDDQKSLIGGTKLNEDEFEVETLIKKLYQKQDRVKALFRFEEWYFYDRGGVDIDTSHGVSMHPHLIRKLLKGEKRYPGLIQSCKLSHCKTAWRNSLSLLCKLVDVEQNKYARMFIQVFLNIDHSLYREMDLHRHIKDSTQEHGFQIVQLIHEGLPRLDPTVYVADAESWIQYLKWSKIQNDSYIVGINLEPEQIEKEQSFFNIKHYLKPINKQEHEQEFINNYKKQEEEFNYKKLSLDIFEKYEDFSFEPDDEYRFIHKVNEKYCGISMQVRCKKDFYNDHWKIKISFIINHEPLTVYNFLRMSYIDKNDIIRNGWDKKLIDRKIVTKLDTNNFICHEIYKSFNSP